MKKKIEKEENLKLKPRKNPNIGVFNIIGALVVLFETLFNEKYFPKNIERCTSIYYGLTAIIFILIIKELVDLYKGENKKKKLFSAVVLFLLILSFSNCRFALTSLNIYRNDTFYCSTMPEVEKKLCKEYKEGKLLCHSDYFEYDYLCEKNDLN